MFLKYNIDIATLSLNNNDNNNDNKNDNNDNDDNDNNKGGITVFLMNDIFMTLSGLPNKFLIMGASLNFDKYNSFPTENFQYHS